MKGLLAPLLKLGIFIVVTVTATALLALTILNANFTDTNSYTARFSNVSSLNEGDDVRIAGVRVGQVQDIEIVRRNYADVEFTVQQGVRVPESVRAAIKYRNLIGQRFVSLEQQPGGDPNDVLAPGARIALERTSPALDLTYLFNGFQPLFTALSPNDVNTLSFQIIQVLQGEGGTVQSLLTRTASLTKTIAGKDRVIGQVIDNLNSVLDTVNSRRGELSDLIVTVQQLVDGLAKDRKPIGDAVVALGDLADTTSGLLDDARAPLRADIAELGKVTDTLNGSKELVEGFIQGLPNKAAALTRTASYGSWVNFFLCGAKGQVSLPVLGELDLPVLPRSQPRCTR